jgi:ABC-type antimicrobial peptide transport system permease subunit
LPANAFAAQLRAEQHALDASLPVAPVHPLGDVVALSLLPQRVAGVISLALGGIGLLLAAIGLYGLIAMHVASRVREYGVRIALGATPRRVLREILRRGAWLLGFGLAIGLLLSLGSARLMSGLLFGTGIGDLPAFLGAALLLAATAMFACWLPARRVARIAPIEALRNE